MIGFLCMHTNILNNTYHFLEFRELLVREQPLGSEKHHVGIVRFSIPSAVSIVYSTKGKKVKKLGKYACDWMREAD